MLHFKTDGILGLSTFSYFFSYITELCLPGKNDLSFCLLFTAFCSISSA